MTTATIPKADTSEELTITRIFDAPRELVFRMWSEPSHMQRWSCPHGFTVTEGTMDFRLGGLWSACMRSPEGQDLRLQGQYKDIIAGKRIVMTHAWIGEDGRPGPSTLVSVTFADHEGKTKMTLHQTGFESRASRDGHFGGWTECFEKLGAYLSTLESTGE